MHLCITAYYLYVFSRQLHTEITRLHILQWRRIIMILHTSNMNQTSARFNLSIYLLKITIIYNRHNRYFILTFCFRFFIDFGRQSQRDPFQKPRRRNMWSRQNIRGQYNRYRDQGIRNHSTYLYGLRQWLRLGACVSSSNCLQTMPILRKT